MVEADGTSKAAGRGLVTWALVTAHAVGFGVMQYLTRTESDAAVMFRLGADSLHPAGILLHAWGETRIAYALIAAGYCWWLGRALEERFGGRRLLGAYLLGTVIGGIVYMGLAQLSPEHAGTALTTPVGALGAWTLGAVRGLKDRRARRFGKERAFSQTAGAAAGITAAAVFYFGGPGATGWLLAGMGGASGWLVCVRGRG